MYHNFNKTVELYQGYDTEIINYDRCFWQLESVSENCNCNKVYFRVFVNLKFYDISICHDLYVMLFKEHIMRKTHYRFYQHNKYEINIEILHKIIKEIFPDRIDSDFISDYDITNRTLTIITSRRPMIYYKASPMKIIQFYYFNYDKLDHKQIYNIKILVEIAIRYLKEWIEYQKMKKRDKIIQKIDSLIKYYYVSDKTQMQIIEIINDINFEIINQKITDL